MGAIERFLERWGYARLEQYGLVKTPDGRILSTRPAVLNDGLNGKIVGWLEGDLAAMELERWGEAPRAPAKTVAGKKIISQRAASTTSPPPLPGVAPAPVALAPAAPAPRPLPGVAPAPILVAQAPAPAPIAIPAPRPVPIISAPAPVVAEAPPVEEDEWEWEIAMARARAAADQVEQAVVASSFTKPAQVARPRRTAQGMAIPKPEPLPAWPKTEELERFRDEWTEVSDPQPRVMSPLEKTLAVARSTPSSGVKAVPSRLPAPTPGPLPARSTIIPVPSLPTARPADLKPAFSSAQAPRRLARGTGTGANGRIDDTVQTQPAPPANDTTSPYITMPSEVKPVGYAHTKRVAAKQR